MENRLISDYITAEESKNININDLMKKLMTKKAGLSSSEVKDRIQKFGTNEIIEEKINPFVQFLYNFWGPIPWMIEIAMILSAISSHWPEFFIIAILLLLNSIISFWEKRKADNAIELLKEKLALKATVQRDDKWVEIDASGIVPGDIIHVRLGSIIPADIKLFEGDYLFVDQSTLTGESLPVTLHRSDVGYSGSIVMQGEMNGIVISTGMNTNFGKTSKLIGELKKKSHFQKAIMKIGDFLIIFVIFLSILIFLVGIFRHETIIETLHFVLVLMIAAVPAALPAVLTITMAVGATKLAKKDAIVSRLSSIEELAGVDILCTDKTGTITKNKLSVAEIQTFENFTEEDVFLIGILASREENHDPIDDTIIAKGKTLELVVQRLDHYQVLDFTPFDPIIKHTEAIIQDTDATKFKVAKGAPQVILSLLSNQNSVKDKVNEIINASAIKGYRTLSIARTNDMKGEWHYVGSIALFDPPREDSALTISKAKDLGLQVKMITGDHIAIAKEIAERVNLSTNIIPMTSSIFKNISAFTYQVEAADGFAQVLPEHKYEIVKELQKNNHIVGMTGDGVNDAPALKSADVGIAVHNATDAARAAADIVFTKPGLSVIIDAIIESRKIFQRMNNYALYRIAETIRILLFIASSIIIFDFYPITAVMIVLLAILNDAPIMTISLDNVKTSNKPDKWNMAILLPMATFLGIVGVISSFILLYIGNNVLNLTPNVLQTLIFLKLSVAGHLTVFATRTKGYFWSIKPSTPLFTAIIITQIIATFISVYGIFLTPMSWNLVLLVWGYAFLSFIIIDFLKVRFYKVLDECTEVKFHQ